MITKFITTDDDLWLSALDSCEHDFYHLPGYCSLAAKYEGGRAVAFYTQEGNNRFLAPLSVRDVPKSLNADNDWRDAASPYGYSSPIVTDSDDVEFLEKSLQLFRDECERQGLISVLIRLHPLIPISETCLSKYGNISNRGQIVYMDLSLSCDDLWSQMRRNHKQDIKKLSNHNFSVLIDKWDYFNDYIDIYLATMKRVKAGQQYFFPKEYFLELKKACGDEIHLFTVLSPDNRVVSSGLFTKNNGFLHCHLAGTLEEYIKWSPIKLMFYEACNWGKQTNCSLFHMGGGVGAKRDTLFHFKAGFSKMKADYNTFEIVIDRDKYDYLSNIWMQKYSKTVSMNGHFPNYRSPTKNELSKQKTVSLTRENDLLTAST